MWVYFIKAENYSLNLFCINDGYALVTKSNFSEPNSLVFKL